MQAPELVQETAENDPARHAETNTTEETQGETADESDSPCVVNVMCGMNAPFSQVLTWFGCKCNNYDIEIDPQHDLRSEAVREKVEQDLTAADLFLSGMDCNSFTRARDKRLPHVKGGGPPQLRSVEHPCGLPALLRGSSQKSRIEDANMLSEWILRMNAYMHNTGRGFLDENPGTATDG